MEVVRDDADLHADMDVTDAQVAEALRRVEQAYRDHGFPEARAEPTWEETDTPGHRRLTLTVREGRGQRLRAVSIDGISGALTARALEAVGLAADDLASPQRIHAGEESLGGFLRREGYLDAQVRSSLQEAAPGDTRLRYEVEAGRLYAMVWYGAFSMPEDALVEALRLGDELGFTDATLAAFSARIQDFYARRGWYDARVRATLAEDDAQRRVVHFLVREGRQAVVRALRFEDAHVLSSEELTALVESTCRNELPSTPTTYRGRLDPAHTYTPGAYATAAARIVDAYRERGYLDAAVATPVVARADTRDGPRLTVTFRITEGPRTWVEELAFEGNRTQPSAVVAEVWAMRLGVPVSHRDIGEARLRLADWYHEQGYAFARVEPEVERSPDHGRARVRVVVHEGPRVRIGRIEIRGNRVTRDFVVRSRLDLHEGDTFSLSALRTSQRQLYELGVFSNVNVGLDDGDLEAPVKTLLVRVVEERRVSLELRAGFSLGQGGRLGAEFTWLNLGGVSMNLSVRPELGYLFAIPIVAPTPPDAFNVDDWDVTRVTGRFPVSLAFPYLPGFGSRFRASLDAAVSRVLQPWSYDLLTAGIGGTLTWRPVQRLSFSWTTELQRINVGLFGADTIQSSLQRLFDSCLSAGSSRATCEQQRLQQRQSLLRYAPGVSDLLAVRLGAVWDGRDNPLTPRSGFYASITGELLRLLGFQSDSAAESPSDTTLHVEARVTGYIPLPVLDMVLALSARGGRNITLAGSANTHPSRLFWLGGAGSMRGWTQNQLLPQDTVDAIVRASTNAAREAALASAQGGEFYLNAVADLRVPLSFLSSNIAFGAFLDVGNVWRTPPPLADWFRLRYSPGFGLRYISPVGIIALDFGFVLAPVEVAGESAFQTVQFYLGNTL